MLKLVEAQITPEQLENASKNYLRCLNLPPSSQVLIITDKLPTSGFDDPHLNIRRGLSSTLKDQIIADHKVVMIEFGEKPTAEELHNETERALKELGGSETTTIIYLGNDWKNRRGIYQAANEFGANHTVKIAGSLGFTTGDCRVMSELNETQTQKINEASKYFEDFFKKNPKGSFKITTRGLNGQEQVLKLDYNTKNAPFKSELGQLDGIHETPLSDYKNVNYVNIPGGENYGTPFPFKNANGIFSAEGITFIVKEGLLVHVDLDKNVQFESLSPEKKVLITRTRDAANMQSEICNQYLPIAELGLGFYELAGIRTYIDSSILTREKTGPHIAFGHTVIESTEQDEIDGLARDFHHEDFVLDNAAITWSESQGGFQTLFYSPFKN